MSDVVPLDAPQPSDEPLQMNAYYFGFDETGVAIIDRILSAVARAGKGYHHTECWDNTDEYQPVSYVDQIQQAANDAAEAIRRGLVTATPADAPQA